MDFIDTYWHVDCVRKMSLSAFTDHYQKWCSRRKYNFSKSKAEEIYGKAKELIPELPKDNFTKRIIKHTIEQLNSASQTVEQLRALMSETASKPPEYPVVMAMEGVGPSLGPQLMAEIGDVTRFTQRRYHSICWCSSWCQRFRRLFAEKRTCLQTRFASAEKNPVPDHEGSNQSQTGRCRVSIHG